MKKPAFYYILGFLIVFLTSGFYGCAKQQAPAHGKAASAKAAPAKPAPKPDPAVVKADMAQFDDLFAAVKSYTASGSGAKSLKPKDFNPLRLEKGGYLSKAYGGFPYNKPNYNWTSRGGWAGASPVSGETTAIGIGISGLYKNIEPIIQKYKSRAAVISFPYPKTLKAEENPDTAGLLIITFPRKAFKH